MPPTSQQGRQGQKLEVGFVTSLSKASKLFYKCYFYCTFQDKHVLKSIDQMQVQKDMFLVVFSERDRPQISSSEWETSRVWGTLLQNLCLLNCSRCSASSSQICWGGMDVKVHWCKLGLVHEELKVKTGILKWTLYSTESHCGWVSNGVTCEYLEDFCTT